MVAVVAPEVLVKRVETFHVRAVFGCAELGDDAPLFGLVKPVEAGVDRLIAIGLGVDEEAMDVLGFPVIDKVAVATGALVSEAFGDDIFTFFEAGDEIFSLDLRAVIRHIARVPDAEDDSSFGGRVDLYSEVAAMEPASLVVGGGVVSLGPDLVVEPLDFFFGLEGVFEVDARGVPPLFKVELCSDSGWAGEFESFDGCRTRLDAFLDNKDFVVAGLRNMHNGLRICCLDHRRSRMFYSSNPLALSANHFNVQSSFPEEADPTESASGGHTDTDSPRVSTHRATTADLDVSSHVFSPISTEVASKRRYKEFPRLRRLEENCGGEEGEHGYCLAPESIQFLIFSISSAVIFPPPFGIRGFGPEMTL